jgi:hypothetical protein
VRRRHGWHHDDRARDGGRGCQRRRHPRQPRAGLHGDVGGFGVGSGFAWQAVGTLRWQASEGHGVLVAYRYIAMDYDNGRNKDGKDFEYDMTVAGPASGFAFAF